MFGSNAELCAHVNDDSAPGKHRPCGNCCDQCPLCRGALQAVAFVPPDPPALPAGSTPTRRPSARRLASTFSPPIPPSQIPPERRPSQSDDRLPRAPVARARLRSDLRFSFHDISVSPGQRGAPARPPPQPGLSPAYAHAVCGARIFPATLAIDDPGVLDELTLPAVSYVPFNSDGAHEWDASFGWTKTITPGMSVVIGAGPTWEHPGGYGWNGLDTELQWQALCLPDAEFMFKVGFDIRLGRNRHGSAGGLRRTKHLLSAGRRRSRLWNAAGRSQVSTPVRRHRRIRHVLAGTGLDERRAQRVHVQLGVHPPIQPAILQHATGRDRQRLPQASRPDRRVRFSDADLQWRGRRR